MNLIICSVLLVISQRYVISIVMLISFRRDQTAFVAKAALSVVTSFILYDCCHLVLSVFDMEILTEESINPAFKRVKYGVRGWLEGRSYEIQQELARVSKVMIYNIFSNYVLVTIMDL